MGLQVFMNVMGDMKVYAKQARDNCRKHNSFIPPLHPMLLENKLHPQNMAKFLCKQEYSSTC